MFGFPMRILLRLVLLVQKLPLLPSKILEVFIPLSSRSNNYFYLRFSHELLYLTFPSLQCPSCPSVLFRTFRIFLLRSLTQTNRTPTDISPSDFCGPDLSYPFDLFASRRMVSFRSRGT